MITLKPSGNCDQAVSQLKNLTSNRELQLMRYNKKIEINATQHTNPMDDYPEFETTIANVKEEQNSEPVIAKVIKWLETESVPTANIYSNTEEQKYLQQLRQFFTENGILYRRYVAHDGKMLYKQLCVPKTAERRHVQNT